MNVYLNGDPTDDDIEAALSIADADDMGECAACGAFAELIEQPGCLTEADLGLCAGCAHDYAEPDPAALGVFAGPFLTGCDR